MSIHLQEEASVPLCHFAVSECPVLPREAAAGIIGNSWEFTVAGRRRAVNCQSSCLSHRTDQINQLIGSIWLFLDPQEPGGIEGIETSLLSGAGRSFC